MGASKFGDYVKKARTEKPVNEVLEATMKPKLEQEPSTLEAELSSLSTYSSSMNIVKPTQKFNKRVKNRLNFEASLKPATNAKVGDEKKATSITQKLSKEDRERAKRNGGGGGHSRPRTPMIISASPSMQNLASGVSSVLVGESSQLEPSSSQVFPFMNENNSEKPKLKAGVPRPKFSSVPVAFVDEGKVVGGAKGHRPGSATLTKEQRAKLAATLIDKVDAPSERASTAEGEKGAEQTGTRSASAAGGEKEEGESKGNVAASQNAEEGSVKAPSTKAGSEASVALSDRSNKTANKEETTSQLKASISKLSKMQIARWKDIIRTDTLTPRSLEEHRRIANFNKTVAMLRERIYAKSSSSISAHFQALDLDRKGALDRKEFRKALDAFNLGECLTDQTTDMLVSCINDSGSEPVKGDKKDLVNYAQFTEALRMGRIGYIHQPGKRLRIGPDPEKPFGSSAIKRSLPYGIMEDGEKNSKIFDMYLRNLYVHVEGLFKNYDKKSKGTMKIEDFQHALKKISTDKGLKLSEDEIQIVSEEVSKDESGDILYSDFLNGFKRNNSFTIPEFLKPKTLRRSQSGHPWTWTVSDIEDTK